MFLNTQNMHEDKGHGDMQCYRKIPTKRHVYINIINNKLLIMNTSNWYIIITLEKVNSVLYISFHLFSIDDFIRNA